MNADVEEQRPDPSGATDGDELSLIQIANVLLRHRLLILILPVVLAGLGAIFALTRDRLYTAHAAFLAQDAEVTGGLAEMARSFGANIGTRSAGQSPQFYASLLKRRELLRKAVQSEFEVATDSGRVRISLIDYYGVVGNDTFPAWRLASDALQSSIDASVAGTAGVVELEVSAREPELAEQIAARLLELLNEFNLNTRQSQAREEERFVSNRVEDAEAKLRRVEEELANFLRQNRHFEGSPDLSFEHDRLQRQIAVGQELYMELVRSREQARIAAVRNTPVITVIEQPSGSVTVEGAGVGRIVLLALFLGGMLAVLTAMALELGRRSKEENQDDYREFDRLKRETAQDFSDLVHLRFRRLSQSRRLGR